MYLNKFDLQQQERFYRANLVNCLSGTKPAVLVGTTNLIGQSNLALFSNIFHLGADPALLGYVQRPIGASGHTFNNIENTHEYTFNFVSKEILLAAHQTSAKVPEDLSEFGAFGFTEKYLADFRAPFVQECAIQIGLRLVEVIPIKHNNTRIVIGSIEHILLPDELVQPDGNLIINDSNMLSVIGLETYYEPHFIKQLNYAKWNQS